MNPKSSNSILKHLRRRFGSKLTSLQVQKKFESKLKRLLVYTSFGTLGLVIYHNVVNVDLDVIFTPTDRNLNIINSLRDIKRMKYKSCPLLFNSFMEVVYGSFFDHRDYVDYQREVIFTPDSENLALGYVIRLGDDARQNGQK